MTNGVSRKKRSLARTQDMAVLTLMVLPAFLLITVFHYGALPGIAIAFAKYNVGGFHEWVGFENFEYIFGLKNFWRAFANNWRYVGLNYLFIFPSAIIMAILFNEVQNHFFKKFVQTVSTVPNFLAWSTVGGIWVLMLSPSSGYINVLLNKMGFDSIYFFSYNNLFPFLYVFIAIWKNVGYNSIIYMAALSGISEELYEAAAIDGAGRFKQILHITLPGLKPTILVMFVLSFASVLNLFEPLYVLSNTMVSKASMVLDTYIYSTGITNGRYDIATAMGLFKSTISLVLVLASNYLSKRMTEDGSSIL